MAKRRVPHSVENVVANRRVPHSVGNVMANRIFSENEKESTT